MWFLVIYSSSNSGIAFVILQETLKILQYQIQKCEKTSTSRNNGAQRHFCGGTPDLIL
mgnify:CR=1 FL=1